MEQANTTVHGPAPSLLGGVAGLAKNVFGLLVSRVELAALELSEVRNHILALLAVFALGVISVLFAIGYGTALIVALSWDSMGWRILLVLFLVFLAATVGLYLKAKSMLAEDKLAFPETMNELKHDRDMLL